MPRIIRIQIDYELPEYDNADEYAKKTAREIDTVLGWILGEQLSYDVTIIPPVIPIPEGFKTTEYS
jgi:hypothetical protein